MGYIDTLSADPSDPEDPARQRLDLQSRLLYGLPERQPALSISETYRSRLEDLARLPLGYVLIETASVENLVLKKEMIDVNNLARPFLPTPALLAALQDR